MQSNSVVAFPLDRASIRRLAFHDAEIRRPMSETTLEGGDRLAYEHAYVQHQRDLDAEIAECA